MDGVESSGSMN